MPTTTCSPASMRRMRSQDLLDAQRPLLVPRPRQAEGLVPGRELDGPGPGVAAQGDGQGLEHDALDVVLGLGLGQAERVDLDAVAEAQVLGVLHAVALAADLLPQDAHGPELRVLLDEAHAGVDEEGDAGEHPPHELLRDPGLDGVEHGDRVGQRVGDLLDRRGPGLLEVVGADVDRVPLRDPLHRVGDHVGDEPHGRLGREGVRPAGQELLDDVVLGRPLERLGGDVLPFGGDDVEGQQPGGRGVDRHRRVHLVERDPLEQRGHVAPVGDGHADLPHLAARQHVIGVVARLRGQIEGHGQPGLALGQVRAVQLVGLGRRGVARVGAHHPRAIRGGKAMIHGRRILVSCDPS
jgi:hypothetical protein